MQYDDEQRDLLLRMVEDGNKSQGGLNHLLNFYGIVGFVKFTTVWYLIVITQRSVVGLLGGHYSELGALQTLKADNSLPLRQDKGDEHQRNAQLIISFYQSLRRRTTPPRRLGRSFPHPPRLTTQIA